MFPTQASAAKIRRNNLRSAWDYLQKKYAGQKKVITESYLRTEVGLATTSTLLDFKILENEPTASGNPLRVTEKRLNVSDNFLVTKMGFFHYVEAEPGVDDPGVQPLRTYPNSIAYAAAADVNKLQTIYNGTLEIRVNSTVYFDSYDMMSFYRAPTSQQGVDVSTGANPDILSDGWDSPNYGLASITPYIEFGGTQKNVVKVNAATTGSYQAKAVGVMIFKGLLIQDGK